MNLVNFEKKIKIYFKNKKLLQRSLTHKSYDNKINNEKLEFLGDRVLGFVIAKKLIELYPEDNEGLLDKKLALLVNKNTCAEIGFFLCLENVVKTHPPSSKKKVENKIISDTCEALIGAIFLDQGIKTVENFILKLWKSYLIKNKDVKKDPKTRLQEYSLEMFKELPIYKLVQNIGPRHKPLFKIAVKVKNSKNFFGEGLSKKDAEQTAALKLLENLNIL